MRYTIEAKSKKNEGVVEELLKKDPSLKLVDKYDPFEKIGDEVLKMGEAMRKFKLSGISWSVFNYYLRGKGIPQSTIDAVMGETKEFFIKVGLMEKE